MTWIQTYTGKAVDLENPDPASICIEDIAHALSNICRFTGHSKFHYSVAQHCVLLSNVVAPIDAQWALMHDAHEAYVNDLAAPQKRCKGMDGYKAIEARLQNAVESAFGMYATSYERDSAGEADLRMLMTEARQVLTWPPPKGWGFEAEPYAITIAKWTPEFAKQAYLRRFDELGIGDEAR